MDLEQFRQQKIDWPINLLWLFVQKRIQLTQFLCIVPDEYAERKFLFYTHTHTHTHNVHT